MNAKISVLVICVETIMYLLLYNLHDCNFKSETNFSAKKGTRDGVRFVLEYMKPILERKTSAKFCFGIMKPIS